MNNNAKKLLIKELSQKYGSEIVENENIFVVKNASKPYAPIIPEEVDTIINNVGTVVPLRIGQVAYSIYDKDLIVQLSP